MLSSVISIMLRFYAVFRKLHFTHILRQILVMFSQLSSYCHPISSITFFVANRVSVVSILFSSGNCIGTSYMLLFIENRINFLICCFLLKMANVFLPCVFHCNSSDSSLISHKDSCFMLFLFEIRMNCLPYTVC